MSKENISDKPIDVLNIQKVLFIINNDNKWELFVNIYNNFIINILKYT